MGQNDIFVHETDAEVIEVAEKRMEIPSNYIEVKLDSMGKFDAPPVLHFRNYTMEDLNILASSTDKDTLKNLIKVLNNMVWEDFDCSKLVNQELEEVLLTIYVSFWLKRDATTGEKEFSNMPYWIDTTLDSETINSKENVGYATFPISAVSTIPIKFEFKEPINIKIGEESVGFRFSRIGDLVFTQEFIDEKFLFQDRNFSDFEVLLRKTQEGKLKNKIDPQVLKEYEEYQKQKDLEFLKVGEALMITSYKGEKLKSIEEKIDIVTKLDVQYWTKFQSIVRDYSEFGINEEIEFEVLNKETGEKEKLKRRFSFQLEDLIPSDKLADVTEATVSFGD